MTYNCPKCHCGCLFEDHGRLVCLNCGAETAKAAAKNARHVHHYQTYTGKKAGTSERPKSVKQPHRQTFQEAPPSAGARHSQTSGSSRTLQPKQKQSMGCLLWIAVFIAIVFFILPFLTSLVTRIGQRTAESSYAQAEEVQSGILYWVADGEVSDEEAEILDGLVLDYNMTHDVPDMEEVRDYLTERVDEMPFGSWSVGDDGDGDVCLIVYP